MTQPDPAFTDYFAGAFQRELAGVSIPGMTDASWDRKAAWLLFVERGQPRAPRPAPAPPEPIPTGGLFD